MKINKFVIRRMVFDLSSKLIHSWLSLLQCGAAGVSRGGGTRKSFVYSGFLVTTPSYLLLLVHLLHRVSHHKKRGRGENW